MAKTKTLWLTRDDKSHSNEICLFEYREFPQKHDGEYLSERGRLLTFAELINASGIILDPGQRVKARLVVKE